MATTTKGRTDSAEIIRAYQLLVGDGNVTELRTLEAQRKGDYRPGTLFGYFDNAEALAAAVSTIKAAKGIYTIPNAVNPVLLARAANRLKIAGKGDSTQDTDILRRRYLLIDADPVRPAGISASDAEHAAALDRVERIADDLRHNHGWPDPIRADSGNGGHLCYRIDLAADDGGMVQRCLQALAARFDDEVVKVDQGVYNPARIWKLYGTLACKGDDTPDRPWRMARILEASGDRQVVSVELLQPLADQAPQPATAAQRQDHGSGNGEPFDIDAFIRRHGLEVDGPEPWNGAQGPGRRWTFRQCPMCEHGGDGPYIVEHESGAVSAGCPHNSCKSKWGWTELRGRLEPRAERPSAKPQGQRQAATRKSAARSAINVERFRPFPVDALPGPLDSFVDAVSRAMVCDPSYVALPILVAMAAAIGSTRRIVLKHGWSEPAILWVASVGESGTTKTPPFKAVMKPIRDLQGKALQLHAEEMRDHKAAMARYDRDLGRWKKDKGDDDPPEAPEQPKAVRYIVGDTTVEALAPLLLENPRGLLLARDELAGWIGSFDRYAKGRGGDSAHWLSMHNGEALIVDRKTGTPRTIFVPQAYVSVCGGIQPGILNRALGVEHRESGLAARLLLTCPPRRPKRWTEADIAPRAEAEFARMLGRLYSLEPSADKEGNPVPLYVGVTPDAKRLWVAFYNAHGAEQADLSGDLAAAWSKLEGYAPRLALIVHYARWAADDSTLEHPERVDADSMRRAVALAEWFKTEALRVYGFLGETDEQRERRELADWIDKRGGSVTARDLQQRRRGYRTADDAEAALNDLVKAGYGAWQEVPTTAKGGRPHRVLSAVYTTPGNPEENRGSVDVDSVDAPETQDGQWGEI